MLPSLTVAFCVGLVLGSFLPYCPLTVSCLLLLTIIVSALLERHYSVPAWRTTVLFGLLLVGLIYWSGVAERKAHLDPFDERRYEGAQEVSGRIVAPVQQGPDRLVMVVTLDPLTAIEGQPRRVRLTWHTPERLLFHGDCISFRAKLHEPSGSLNPGGFDYATYLERQGIDAVATVSGADGVALLESGLSDRWWSVMNRLDRWRGGIRLAAVQSLSQPALGIYLGIVVGERGYLDGDLRDLFMVTGTVHLLSISGSHLGLVAILTFMVIRRSMLGMPADWLLRISRTHTPTRIAALVTVVPVTVYALLAGAELATMRSLLMVLVALLVRWLGYEQRIFHAIALAAAVILLHDPQAIYDISFQLSFLSVSAIAAWLSSRRVEEEEPPQDVGYAKKGLEWGRDAILVSGLVTLATMPLVAFYFNQFPWLGLLTNIVAVPVMGIVLVPLGLLAGTWPLLSGENSLAFASVLQWLIDGFSRGLSLAAMVPDGEWHVAAPSVPLMLIFYGLLVAMWWSSGLKRLRWFSGVGAMLILMWWIWSPRVGIDGERFRVTFLDVAQGDSAVLELPNGQVVLIDGGSTYERFDMGRGVVGPYLWNRGIRSLDHVIATHPQLDHVGGLAWVLKHFPVQRYWGIGEQRDELFFHRLQQSLDQRGLVESVAYEGEEIALSGACRLLVLNPPSRMPLVDPSAHSRKEGQRLNNRSIVTRLTCGNHSMLFAADVEHEALSRMQRTANHEPVEVVKVPHHGAASSLHREWIASLRPQHAVLSVGRHNPYGHPVPSVVDAYVAQGVQTYRTDRDGGIWVTGSPNHSSLAVHRTRELTLRSIVLFGCVWECEKANWHRLWEQWRERV
jgi:competence protein ComEC